ncbi:MAG: hypothetical protein LBV72_00810 [Tannerella sp.]|jgi:hypothetical protein|nr:hypothetical protein [Tannerella sp.]
MKSKSTPQTIVPDKYAIGESNVISGNGTDTLYIKELLETPSLYHKENIPGTDIEIDLPYNITIQNPKNVTHTLWWDLCDLRIDSDLETFRYAGFRNRVPIGGVPGFAGHLYFIPSDDPKAVTLEKFKEMHRDEIDQIIYSDPTSVVYTLRGNGYALHFRYLESSKTYAIYQNQVFSIGGLQESDVIDIALVYLRMARNLFDQHDNPEMFDWQAIEKTLSKVESRHFNDARTQIHKLITTDANYLPDDYYDLAYMMKTSETITSMRSIFKQIPRKGYLLMKGLFTDREILPFFRLRDEDDGLRIVSHNGDDYLIEKKAREQKGMMDDTPRLQRLEYAPVHFTRVGNKPVMLTTLSDYGTNTFRMNEQLARVYLEFFKSCKFD